MKPKPETNDDLTTSHTRNTFRGFMGKKDFKEKSC